MQTKLEAEELRPFHLLSMTIDGTTYRYTDCDVSLAYDSNVYSPRGFRLNPINYSMGSIVDQVEIQLDNIDTQMNALFVGASPQGDSVSILLVIVDDDKSIVGATSVTLFQGEIDSYSIKEDLVKVTVSSKLAQWSQKTLSKHSASCRWKVFNSSTLGSSGIECASTAGGASCDRTYDNCTALGNSTNFGGFRFLPSIIGKDIWWGRVRG
jgi:hypothetical protein